VRKIDKVLDASFLTGVIASQRWICVPMLWALLCTSGGCKLILSKGFVTEYHIEDTKSNRIAVSNCVDSIATEFGLKPSSQSTNRIVTYVCPGEGWLTVYPEKTEPALHFEDIRNLESLAYKLKEPMAADELSRCMRGWLSASTLDLLANYSGGTNHMLQEALCRDLSRACIRKGLLYNPEEIGSVKLSPEALHLLEQAPHEPELYRLNRMLLVDAYPDEIRRMRKDCLLISFTNTGRRVSQKHLEIRERLTEKLVTEFDDGSVSVTFHSYWLP
jgi:hypothetical protein